MTRDGQSRAATARREAKCSHVASAQVNRPGCSDPSSQSEIDHMQWPQVGFSMQVRAGAKCRHRTHIRLFIVFNPFSTPITFPPYGAIGIA